MAAITLSIAGVAIGLETPEPLTVTEAFQPFLLQTSASCSLCFHPVDKLEQTRNDMVLKQFHLVRDRTGAICRLFFSGDSPVALTRFHPEQKQMQITYLASEARLFQTTDQCLAYAALELLLIQAQRMVLHSACVDTPLGGLLFSGPSGAGKSTQGDLWVRYGSGQLVNGDRTILEYRDGHWLGHGSPYAGSSRCHRQAHAALRAIVFPVKAPACQIRRLSQSEAFRRLYAQLTINTWNPDFVQTALDLLTALVQQLPVYELACTPDQEAVRILAETLSV